MTIDWLKQQPFIFHIVKPGNPSTSWQLSQCFFKVFFPACWWLPSSPYPHLKDRRGSSAFFSYRDIQSIMCTLPSSIMTHLKSITSLRLNFRMLSPWGLETQHKNIGEYKSVYNKSRATFKFWPFNKWAGWSRNQGEVFSFSVIHYKNICVIFPFLAQNTWHPQCQGGAVYLGSQFGVQSMVTWLQHSTSWLRKACKVMKARKQSIITMSERNKPSTMCNFKYRASITRPDTTWPAFY